MGRVSDDDYFAARDALVIDGVLARGRGRGGSVMRVAGSTEDEDNEDDWDEGGDDEVDGFELTPTDAPTPRRGEGEGGRETLHAMEECHRGR